jgi:hypothetical protein
MKTKSNNLENLIKVVSKKNHNNKNKTNTVALDVDEAAI